MMRSLIVVALLIVLQAPSVAGEQFFTSRISVTELIDNCRKAGDRLLRYDCAGYFMGIFDQMSFSEQICPPQSDVISRQAITVALKFLNDHPENWHAAPVVLIGQSFKAAFPCRADSPRD